MTCLPQCDPIKCEVCGATQAVPAGGIESCTSCGNALFANPPEVDRVACSCCGRDVLLNTRSGEVIPHKIVVTCKGTTKNDWEPVND
jgi:hypothetical protein